VTVVMSLLMRIYLCFTTDTRDLNGLVEIMFHQHRVTITQNILGGQVLSMFLMPLMTLHGVSTSSTQSKSSKIRKSLQMRMQEEERKATDNNKGDWKMLMVDELTVYYGLVIMKDIIKLDRDAHYWYQRGKHFLLFTISGNVMSRDRFFQIR